MEAEYSRIIFNVKRPSPKAELISFPMYMYRIKTKKFKEGLDFFQKSVLLFNPTLQKKRNFTDFYLDFALF